MKLIAAVDKNWGIGKNGKLLTHIPADLKFFKLMTENKVVVMGRRTYESLPVNQLKHILPERINIILTTDTSWNESYVVHNDKELKEKLKNYNTDDVFIIGGGQLYHTYVDQCDTAYITHIDEEYDADTWFPDLTKHGFGMKEVLTEGTSNNIHYNICIWKKM